MRSRPIIWFLISLLCLVGAGYFWHLGNQWAAQKSPAPAAINAPALAPTTRAPGATNSYVVSASTAPMVLLTQPIPAKTNATNPLAHRLNNTTQTLGQLLHNDHAILLENALIDTARPLGLKIPENLRGPVEPGSYIVQARGSANDTFRGALAAAGATVISYIPNNAYLVRASAATAQQLAVYPQTQSVLPYEPAYKLKATLFSLAMEQKPLPPDTSLNVMVFADAQADTIAEMKRLGAKVLPLAGQAGSPFGPVVTVVPPAENWTSLALLPGVELMELHHRRVSANDLSRVRLGVANDTITNANYLNLTGNGVIVSVNDSGVDQTQPDLSPRVTGNGPGSLVDFAGHGTHVAGIIASSGEHSSTVSNADGSINPGTNTQYRGMAPAARIYSQNLELITGPVSDFDLQQNTALTNALISNNSWHYVNDNQYDIGAASFDAAVRDALPGVTGSQPTLYVFAAGNSGLLYAPGSFVDSGTIQSPGTAKNVITVGALEQPRHIDAPVVINCTTTNINGTNVTVCETNYPWQGMTSTDNEVAEFSSRGNVGVGVEGVSGRFKPDVVAPGTFVVSTRSQQWDQQAYYNPTNHHYNPLINQVVAGNSLRNESLLVPGNAVAVYITVFPSVDSPNPLNLPIFVRQADIPDSTTYDAIRTNQVVIPPDVPLVLGSELFYSVGNPTSSDISYNLLTDIVTTNDYGNYYTVLSNLNNDLGPYYRYESGTSMSAADVSGVLALMQEFFEQRLLVTNSPALYKALLINGARSANSIYSYQVSNPINYQGWGLPSISNSLPAALVTNGLALATPSSMKFFDQSPATALATDQRQTRSVTVNDFGRNQPLRFTLVWTDPPGNPVASIKLVNDLDLIVTNLDTGDVYVGNDIPAASNFNNPVATNTAPSFDSVNNVENVYLSPTLGTNYSVTVVARRVNVNAVTAQTNNVMQDYALVISSGNGEVVDALKVTEQPIIAVAPPAQNDATNTFANYPSISGTLIYNQRVGANPQLLGTTNGIASQWHFYVLTNTTSFTNAAFVTFLPPNLAVPRMGATNVDNPDEATRIEADIDLYVSIDPGLLSLDPNAIANADKSRRRGGTEFVVYSNSVNARVYYVGVKSEDQMASEYSFLGVFSQAPFSTTDSEGNQIVNGLPLPTVVPDGSPADPGAAVVLGIATFPMSVRKVTVTNSLYTENLGDLLGKLSHEQQFAVLNNHRGGDAGNYTFVYDDSGEEPDDGISRPTDGPGSLRDFVGEEGSGVWLLAMVDNSLSQTSIVTGLTLKIAPGLDTNGVTEFDVAPNSFGYVAVDVPVGATNLQICVANITPLNQQPLELYVRRDGFPTRTVYDYFRIIPILGVCLDISTSDLPPLQSGRYYIGVFNPSGVRQRVRVTVTIRYDLAAIVPLKFDSAGNEPLLDDAVTYSSIFVTNVARVAQAEVALRINHPRVSDLAITLISPRGTRVLLMENRGMATPDGVGTSLIITNVVPASTNGGPATQTKIVDTGATTGSLTIDYDFFDVPDQMTIYYQGALLLNTGLINGAGRFNVNYGPGASTQVTIIMNEFGNPSTNTAWTYTVGSVSDASSYLIFTENTNHNGTPIKFTAPPFVGAATGPPVPISTFDGSALGNYPPPPTVDGWSVLPTNPVTVTATPPADTLPNSLALRAGQIQRTLPTIPGRNYRLNFAYRKAPALDGLVSWWRAEGNTLDSVDGNNGILTSGLSYGAGLVNQTFVFTGNRSGVNVGSGANLQLQDFSIEGWIKRSSTTAASLNGNGSGSLFSGGGSGGGYGFWVQQPDGSLALGKSQVNQINSQPGLVSDLAWHHVAVTKLGTTVVFYVDGVAYPVGPYVSGGFVFNVPSYIGAWFNPFGQVDNSFLGSIDELAVYNRELSAAEVQSIYAAGAAGKCGIPTPPSICAAPLGARVFVPGQGTNYFLGNNTWQTGGLLFTATTSNTVVGLAPISGDSGVLVDTFTLTEQAGSRYVLPEQFLKALDGESAYGEWKLEVWDNRAGATNPTPALVNWQLQLVFQSTTPTPGTLVPGVPGTNSVGPGQIAYFIVDVPTWAQFATNTLIFASGPVNLLFNQNIPPTNGTPGNFTLLTNSTGGSATLSTNTVPPLRPGQRYYLGVQNPGVTTVTFALQVDFDITALTNAVPLSSTLDISGVPRYFLFDVSTNATAVTFQLFNTSGFGNVNLVARRGAPLPTLAPGGYDYGSFNTGTADEDIIVFTNSTPVPLAPGRWYLGVFNVGTLAVNYTILATEYTNVFPTIITLTNGIPYFNTNAGFGGPVDLYRYEVSSSAARAQFEINNPSGNMLLLARKGFPPPNGGLFDYRSNNPLTNDELIVIFTNSVPVPLTPGDWFLSAINLAGRPVSYAIKATEWPVTGQPIVITNTIVTSNEFCITWTSLPGVHYYIEGVTDLNSTDWVTVSPTITATDYSTTYCIPLPSPFSFFRVQEGLAGVIGSGFPAFPGAEGAGGDAVGGRGGDVYHVTNLSDSGPGSLRNGAITNNRTIVFDVSGTINLASDLRINRSFLTIAGQTAPGDGITIQGRLTSVQNAHDVVVRYLRFRPGDVNCPTFQEDAFHFDVVSNSIADHVSASWSIDETLSATDSTNVTVQWSMITESLNQSCHLKGDHGYGSLLRYGYGALSFHHNLYADNSSRNPRLGDNLRLNFVNNAVYNWGILPGYSEDDTVDNPAGFTNRLNYVGNYLIAGVNSVSPTTAFRGGSLNTWIYQSGNFMDSNLNGLFDGTNTGWAMFTSLYTQVAVPFSMVPVTTDSAPVANERVLAFGGASQTRDTVDLRVVGAVRTQTGVIINSQAAVGGWPVLNSAPLPLDTDQDGIPDYWETTLGENPLVPNNNNDRDGDIYTDLEEYNNWLAAPHALTTKNTPVNVDLRVLSGNTGNFTFTVTNGAHGTVTLLPDGRTARFTPAINYSGFASFDFNPVNTNTGVAFGPVPVSVMVNSAGPTVPTGIITLTNGIPYANTNLPAATNIDYYRYVVSSNAVRAQFEINNPSGDMTLVARKGLPLPNLASFNYQSTNSYTNDELIVVYNYSSPVPLAPGDWYLAAVNISGGPVAYSIKATEWPVYGTNLNTVAYLSSNSFCLTWDSLIGAHYVVSGRSNLSVTNWVVVSPTITATSTQTTWCVSLPSPYQFFRVTEGLALSTNLATVVTAPTIGSVTAATNGFLLQWTALASQQFQVQWATNLPPVPWMTFTNIITSTNGQFSFLDDGSQTGGLGPLRFYRLQLYP